MAMPNSVQVGRDMAIFRFFKMASAAILDFHNLKILTVRRLKRVDVRRRAKFDRNWSNRGQDMAIFRFSKMATVNMLQTKVDAQCDKHATELS